MTFRERRRPALPRATHVSLKGGSVTIGGLSYTVTYQDGPVPERGAEFLLLLRRPGDRYYLMGDFGLVRVRDGRLSQVANGPDYFAEYLAIPASEAIEDIVAKRIRFGQ